MPACVWETLSCLSASQTPNSTRDMSPKPQSQNKSSYSAWVTVPLPKENWMWVPELWCFDRWSLCVACRQLKPWWNCKCWELLWNNSWKCFLEPWKWLNCNGFNVVSLWHFTVNSTTPSTLSRQIKANLWTAALGLQTHVKSRASTSTSCHDQLRWQLILELTDDT